jgi:hypothetical protein
LNGERTCEEQGVDREPTIKMGEAASAPIAAKSTAQSPSATANGKGRPAMPWWSN